MQKQEVTELRQEALERDKMQKQEAIELRQEATRVRQETALREAKERADTLAIDELRVRAQAEAEELRVQAQAEADERNLAREKMQAEIKAKNKQIKIQANNEFQYQKLDADMKVQLVQMELLEKMSWNFNGKRCVRKI